MKITKRQLRRIIREEKQKLLAESRIRKSVRRSLSEMYAGMVPAGGAPALGPDKKVVYSDGAYALPDPSGNEAYTGSYVTDSEDHPLDQLQDILDMGVRLVDDYDGGEGKMPIKKWVALNIEVSRDNDDDSVYGPPRRWRGGR